MSGGRFRLGPIEVTDRNQIDVIEILPTMEMVLGKKTAADQGTA
jgi:hypothetical protein